MLVLQPRITEKNWKVFIKVFFYFYWRSSTFSHLQQVLYSLGVNKKNLKRVDSFVSVLVPVIFGFTLSCTWAVHIVFLLLLIQPRSWDWLPGSLHTDDVNTVQTLDTPKITVLSEIIHTRICLFSHRDCYSCLIYCNIGIVGVILISFFPILMMCLCYDQTLSRMNKCYLWLWLKGKRAHLIIMCWLKVMKTFNQHAAVILRETALM